MADMNSMMKKMGRNMARAKNQMACGGGVKKYAAGGAVRSVKPQMGSMGMDGGMMMKPSGGGSMRGGGAATKGKKFSGSY